MVTPKSTQAAPVVCSTPPIPATVALRRLEVAYVKKCEQLERAEKHIRILEARLAEKKRK
jgi:hypothetical protein